MNRTALCTLRRAALATSALASLVAAGAHAQEVEKVQPDVAVDEIIVTALKRSTSLQETPLSISAVGETQLSRIGATGINDYFRQVPNLALDGGTPSNRRITLRGVRSAGEATTGLYYDETPLTGPTGTTQDAGSTTPDINLFDVERVEVLRGPQGTLYGSGSMGGTLRVIFNKADTNDYAGAVEAQATTTKGGEGGFYGKGMVNVPLIQDKLGARLVLYREERGGYVDSVPLNKQDINGSTASGGRLMFTFTPTEDLTLRATAALQNEDVDGQSSWSAAAGRYKSDRKTIAQSNSKLALYNVTAEWDLHFATLTATSSYYKWKMLRNSDWTNNIANNRTSSAACGRYFGLSGTTCSSAQLSQYTAWADSRGPAVSWQPMSLETWTHEVRMAGSLFEDKLDWTGGVYYETRKDHVDSIQTRADATTGMAVTPFDALGARYIDNDVKQTAFFGELSYHVTDALTVTGGARRFDYDKTVSGAVTIGNVISNSPVTAFSQVDASAKGWVERVNVNYEFSKSLMVYAQASKGFRPGGANNIPGLTSGLVAFQPDSLWNYEAGVKSDWFDRRLTVNMSAYQIDWDNIQVQAQANVGANFFIITNAGAARIRGLELETTLRPMTGLTLSSAIGVSDAKLTEDMTNSSVTVSGSTGLRGDRLPFVPKFSGSLNADYTWPVADGMNGLVHLDASYTGGTASQFRPTYVYYEKVPAYTVVGARVGVEGEGWGAYAFAQNLTNSVGPVSITSAAGALDQVVSLTPRTLGVMVRRTF
ncbi:TonB-dependent receptor [Caulobacter sp. D4A]|uniref:TonB-dependent receptor n=1 Tax=unclassified Caulobacter TaxID=2648921 RepID=UPI000D73E93A|nr:MULTISPECIES: TonB-dependent receptor [unclassified Caulobacter]PXA85102.1 TonB-dependent receptor [Caulobacter sp. D4A]PXA87682.1 TonB-dependent receptor [Caulobacter sp. D5]